MPNMFGQNVLPEAVQSKRQQLRSRLQSLRQPLKNQREQLVPGPNVIGQAESQFNNARDQFLSRNTLIDRIKNLRNQSSGQGTSQTSSSSSGGSSSGSGSGSNQNVATMQ